jgi:hypothetical protein
MNEATFYKKNGYLLKESFFTRKEIEAILYEARSIFLMQFRAKGYVTGRVCLSELPEEEFNQCLFRLFKKE